jgi:hypothetical protein
MRASVGVVGSIWQPGIGPCATVYELSAHDVQVICDRQDLPPFQMPDDATLEREFTRDNVQDWLDSHAGDFQSIDDFDAQCGPVTIEWAKEDSGYIFLDCMYPEEAE